jgi:hypothetical protein
MKLLLIVLALAIVLSAQTSGPSQMSFSPLGASTGCVAATTGDVLCAAMDGFYISISGGTFQKVATGTVTLPTSLICTTAMLSSGSTGNLTASGCTFK